MPVEIKQLTVRGEIRNEPEQAQRDANANIDLDAFREEILEECRKMMEELLEKRQER